MTKQLENLDFESALLALESLITTMEDDDLSLEHSLKNFEKGIALTRICQSSLNDAEQRIKVLSKGLEKNV
ncbi:MAG: exodeoxyribonuclease VII small subunit [Cocleimonas sp.]|nr:exodeoxyribonuclease VII small subunit [Cocleimonas sp.]